MCCSLQTPLQGHRYAAQYTHPVRTNDIHEYTRAEFTVKHLGSWQTRQTRGDDRLDVFQVKDDYLFLMRYSRGLRAASVLNPPTHQ